MEQQQGSAVAEKVEQAPFEVVGDNIIVELIEVEKVLESGIVLAGESKKRPPEVVVVGVGPLATTDVYDHDHSGDRDGYFVTQRQVVVGDVLVCRKHELLRLELSDDGRELHVLKPTAIIGIA